MKTSTLTLIAGITTIFGGFVEVIFSFILDNLFFYVFGFATGIIGLFLTFFSLSEDEE